MTREENTITLLIGGLLDLFASPWICLLIWNWQLKPIVGIEFSYWNWFWIVTIFRSMMPMRGKEH